MKICVIDIGTNSVHMIIAQVHASGELQIINRDKEMTRLGDGALIHNQLQKESCEATLEALKRCLYLAENHQVGQVICLTTSAVRESENGGDFLQRIQDETGMRVKVITGKEEARLIFLAVKNSMALKTDRTLSMDIGGGSTEIIHAKGDESQWMQSFKLGSNRLAQEFPLSDPPKKSEIDTLLEHIQKKLKPLFSHLKKEKIDYLIGTSGTLNNLAKILLKNSDHAYNSQVTQSPVLLFKDVEDFFCTLCTYTAKERQSLKGLDKKRLNIFVQGAAVVYVCLKQLRIKQFVYCDRALREGVVYDYIAKHKRKIKIADKTEDVRRRSVLNLLEKFPKHKTHSQHVAKLAVKIFDALKPVMPLKQKAREILEFSSLLHDIGYAVNYKQHHKHSYYMIIHSGLLGFSPAEIQTMAWISRYHRRSISKSQIQEIELDEQNQQEISYLSGILRVADALDRSHFGVVKDVKIKIDSGGKIVLTLLSSQDCQWERYEAQKRKSFLEKILDHKIQLKVKVQSDDE